MRLYFLGFTDYGPMLLGVALEKKKFMKYSTKTQSIKTTLYLSRAVTTRLGLVSRETSFRPAEILSFRCVSPLVVLSLRNGKLREHLHTGMDSRT